MISFTLHGKLAEAVGRDKWDLHAESVAEGLRIIEANTERLYPFLYQAHEGKGEYRVLINGVDHTDVTELQVPRKNLATVDVMPVPQGSAAWWKIVVGVILIVVAVVLLATGWGSPGGIGLASFALGFMLSSGFSLALGGIAELLAPSPTLAPGKANTSKDKLQTDSKDGKPNYLFSGTVNTVSQGNCVPLLY